MDGVSDNLDLNINEMQIQTFAFFDLETTGIFPKYDRITEIALVAVTREDFLWSVRNDCVFPRIISKICMAVNPAIGIRPIASKISGITNAHVKKHQNFRSAFEALSPFIARLPKPLCLVTHNGRRFDIPMLKNELARYNLKLDRDIRLLDTLFVLPKLDKKWLITPTNSAKKRSPIRKLTSQAAACDEEEIVVINENFSAIYTNTRKRKSIGVSVETRETPLKKVRSSVLPVSNLKVVTNTKDETRNSHDADVVIIDEPKARFDGMGYPNRHSPIVLVTDCMTSVREFSSLTVDQQAKKCSAQTIISRLSDCKLKYNQPAVYRRLFNTEPKASHTAEGDCVSLLEIVLQYGEDFVDEADKNATMIATLK